MPALQYDYDDYDYIVRKKSTARKKSVSTPTKNFSRGYAPQGTRRATQSPATARTTTAKTTTAKTTAARTTAARTASTRNITARTSSNIKNRKTAAKRDLEVPQMLKNKNTKQKVAKPKEMSLKKAEKVVAPKKRARTIAKKKENVLTTIALSMFAFSMLFLICYRSSAINESFNSLGDIKSELETVNTVNAQLASDIETQTDLSNIEMYAKYQLGMQKPKDSQIRKIVVTKEDKISTPVVIESENESFLSSLWHDIVNILD